MKVGERGQVTIPKEIRDRFGIGPDSEVRFQIEKNIIVLKKESNGLKLARWKGYCRNGLKDIGLTSVDRYIEEIRGRRNGK